MHVRDRLKEREEGAFPPAHGLPSSWPPATFASSFPGGLHLAALLSCSSPLSLPLSPTHPHLLFSLSWPPLLFFIVPVTSCDVFIDAVGLSLHHTGSPSVRQASLMRAWGWQTTGAQQQWVQKGSQGGVEEEVSLKARWRGPIQPWLSSQRTLAAGLDFA